MLKNRTFLGLICIAFALLTCFVLTPVFNASVAQKIEIIRVEKNIPKDTLITADMLTKVEVGGYNLPADILKNKDNIVGKYATADLYVGDYILSGKITETPYKENKYLYNLDGSKQVMSMTIKSLALGLSGKLQAGDIISFSVPSDTESQIPKELKYVEIAGVSYSTGKDVSEINNTVESKDQANLLPSTITVYVNDTQARILTQIEAKGVWQAVLVYRGSKDNSQKFIDSQNEVFANGNK